MTRRTRFSPVTPADEREAALEDKYDDQRKRSQLGLDKEPGMSSVWEKWDHEDNEVDKLIDEAQARRQVILTKQGEKGEEEDDDDRQRLGRDDED